MDITRESLFFAFSLTLLAGLSEPLGAVIGYFLLMQFIGPTMFGLVLFA